MDIKETKEVKPPLFTLSFLATMCVLLFALSTVVFWWQETRNPYYISFPHSLKKLVSGEQFQEDQYIIQTKQELEK